HRQFSDEVAELDNMLYDGSLASNMLTPLAPDEASQNHYKAAREHFAKMQETTQQQRTFAVGFARHRECYQRQNPKRRGCEFGVSVSGGGSDELSRGNRHSCGVRTALVRVLCR